MRPFRGILAGAVSLAAFLTLSSGAYAALPPTEAAQNLAIQIENAIDALGANASVSDELKAIQNAIANSGADPKTAEQALIIVDHKGAHTLSANAQQALEDADLTVLAQLDQSHVPAAGGPGGGAPIGAPGSYSSGGGSNYLTK